MFALASPCRQGRRGQGCQVKPLAVAQNWQQGELGAGAKNTEWE